MSEVVALASFCFSLLCGWLLLPLHLKRKVLQKTCPPRQRTNTGPRFISNSEQNVAQQIFCRGESNILGDAKQAGSLMNIKSRQAEQRWSCKPKYGDVFVGNDVTRLKEEIS